MLYKIFKLFSLLIFILYWGSTLLYCSPNNFIRIENSKYVNFFGSVFFQRWTFFTPPPKSNERYYFILTNKTDSSKVIRYEFLHPITSKRKESPLFNVEQEALEYVLTANMYTLNNSVADYLKSLRTRYPDSTEFFFNNKEIELFKNPAYYYPYFKTLLNYARLVCEKNKIVSSEYNCKIVMTTIDIPPFKDRFKKNLKLTEKLSFETYPVSL